MFWRFFYIVFCAGIHNKVNKNNNTNFLLHEPRQTNAIMVKTKKSTERTDIKTTNKINCPKGAQTCALPLFCGRDRRVVFELYATAFCCYDLDLRPMTLKLNHDLDILKTCLQIQAENEVARSSHSKYLGYSLNCRGGFRHVHVRPNRCPHKKGAPTKGQFFSVFATW